MAEVITMPKLGFDMAEGTLVRWVKAEGETIAKGEVLAEIETDKATVEVESSRDGVVYRHIAAEGETLPVGAPIAVLADPGEEVDVSVLLGEAPAEAAPAPTEAALATAEAPAPAASAPPAETPVEGGRLPGGVKASPLARRMAREHGLDLTRLTGTGPGGRIVKRDVEAALAAAAQPAPTPASGVVTPAAGETVPLTRLRAAIGRRMTEAKQQVPHFYVTHEYNMEPLMALRREVNALLAEQGEKASVNDFIVRAVALALREFPNLNASLQGDQVVRHAQINVGVAVAVEGGLLTVVCHEADRKSVRQIAADIREKVGRAREGRVRPEDIEGSTFSVSNLGMYDVEHFIAIINPPEAAILAVGAAREVPVVRDGQIVPGVTMKATLSVDHRVSDGAEAARFLQTLAKYLEEPMRLLV